MMALPATTLELTVRCVNLIDKDVFSKSDPFCVLLQKDGDQWLEVGRTESLKDTTSPAWQTKLVLDYGFEQKQEVKFEVYDNDGKSRRLQDHDFLGRCHTSLGSIVASGRQFVSVLKDASRSNGGKIYVTWEELQSNKDVVEMQLRAEKLDKKDLFGKSDPFFVLSKKSSDGQFSVVYRSEVIQNNLNPTWRAFEKPVREVCNGQYDRSLKVEVFDWDSDGGHDYIGGFITSLSELSIAVAENKTFACVNEHKKQKKSSYKNSGLIKVQSLRIATLPTFLDYIQSGTALHFSVAVDFTASNGDPRDPQSLHFIGGGGQNQYTTAIRAVGHIIEDYDTDKQFPGLGFGARIPPHGLVSHEFFLNLRLDSPFCSGVDGLVQAYHHALSQVTLYGPTNFSPVIEHVAKFADAYQDGRNYFILLIITDGVITDLEATKQSIIKASALPMSIIIVGVGQEDFSSMEALDGDQERLRSGGLVSARDIVQFVELRRFLRADLTYSKEMLAKQVLGEVPNQLVQWMKQRSISPGRSS